MVRSVAAAVAAVTTVVFGACWTTASAQPLADIVGGEMDLSTLAGALNATGLEIPDNSTVFAPINSAFTNFPDQTYLTTLTTNAGFVEHLKELLLYHATEGSILSTDLDEGDTPVTMYNEEEVTVTKENGTVSIVPTADNTSAVVVQADVQADNGVAHMIDDILIPSFVTTGYFDLKDEYPGYSYIYELFESSGIAAFLPATANIQATLVVPSDEAFEKIGGRAVVDEYKNDTSKTIALLLNHVFEGQVLPTSVLEDGVTYQTRGGLNVTVTKEEKPGGEVSFMFGDANVEEANGLARDGIIHGIDMVLLPPTPPPTPAPTPMPSGPTTNGTTETLVDVLGGDTELTTLFGAVVASGLEVPENVTVFAPTDEAFTSFPDQDYLTTLTTDEGFIEHLKNLLLFHVTNGTILSTDLDEGSTTVPMLNTEEVTVNKDSTGMVSLTPTGGNTSAVVVQADVEATNGVAHKINDTLIPFFVNAGYLDLKAQYAGIDYFYELFEASGVGSQIPSGVKATILVPMDSAFEAIGGREVVDQYKNDTLGTTELLLNHVILGNVVPTSVVEEGDSFTTLGGTVLMISKMGESVMFGDAVVEEANALVRDGIIHGISKVLIPSTPAPSTIVPTTMAPTPVIAPTFIPVPSNITIIDEKNTTIIDDVIIADDDLSTVETLVTQAGLLGQICTDCEVALFAPINSAFSNFTDQDLLTKLQKPGWILHLQDLLRFHLTQNLTMRVPSTELTDGMELMMDNDQVVTIGVSEMGMERTITVKSPGNAEPALVTQADIEADNGLVHKIDSILLPAFVSQSALDLKDSALAADYSIALSLFDTLSGEVVGLLEGNEATVFVPTDEAFMKLGNSTLDRLRADSSLVTAVLANHVILNKVIPSLLIEDGVEFDSLFPNTYLLKFSISDDAEGTIMVNNATIVQEDQLANNGILHGIDMVFLTSQQREDLSFVIDDILMDEQDLETSETLVTQAGLMGQICTNCEVVLFAPIDSAYTDSPNQALLTKLQQPDWVVHLRDLLRYHLTEELSTRVLSTDLTDGMELTMDNGEIVTIGVDETGTEKAITVKSATNEAAVAQADIEADNGVLHKIDSVLLPVFAGRKAFDLTKSPQAANFTVLLELFDGLGVDIESLSNNKDVTVFAPTDQAFAKLDNETLQEVLNNVEVAQRVLSYHVLVGTVLPTELMNDTDVYETVFRYPLQISKSADGMTIKVNEATIVLRDELANDGIVHAVDTVLIAPEPTPMPVSPPTPTPPTTEPSTGESGGPPAVGVIVSVVAAVLAAFVAI